MNMSSKQTVSREEYRRLDNRVTCILQQRWPAKDISQWVGMLKGKQQAVACAILRRRHPSPVSLALPTIATEVPNPFQTSANHPTVPVRHHQPPPFNRTGQYHRLHPPGCHQTTQPNVPASPTPDSS
ncbi:hypothetical protein [Aeromonas bestiarum]|uniref:hypothetical protein n=1 Tax=Aeromonas bestiarum TaxID=105751 RepID=UPI0030B84C19